MSRLACKAGGSIFDGNRGSGFHGTQQALLGFFVTLVFGFLIGDANFPRWGMLAFSVGALVLYWLYLGLMSLFMSLPSHDSHHR